MCQQSMCMLIKDNIRCSFPVCLFGEVEVLGYHGPPPLLFKEATTAVAAKLTVQVRAMPFCLRPLVETPLQRLGKTVRTRENEGEEQRPQGSEQSVTKTRALAARPPLPKIPRI